jgi:hypothetical protein
VLDPFAQDDGFVPGKGRKKPRYSLQREDWRIVDEPDSPHEQEGPVDWEQALDQELDEEAGEQIKPTEDQPTEPRPVFTMPSLELTSFMLGRRAEESNNALSRDINQAQVHFPTDTPQIRPVPSPGLPVPSPLVSDHAGSTGYFPSWTASTDTQEITYFSTEPATAPKSFIETLQTETETIEFHQTDAVEPDVEQERAYVINAGFPLRDNLESTSGLDLLKENDEPGDISPTKYEQDFSQVDDSIDNASNQAPIHDEAQLEVIDPFEATDDVGVPQADVDAESAETKVHTKADADIENVRGKADEAQPMNVQSQEEIVADRQEGQLGRDVELVKPESELTIEEDSESLTQSVQYALPTEDIDMDAIHALEMMMGARENEELRIKKNSREEIESGDEIDDSSLATGALDRSRSESHSEEDGELDDEEDRYDEQSAGDYDSQDDYDEEGGQDEFSVDELDADDSEQEQDFPPQARPTQSHEVIVLDSDSEEEPANSPAKSASQPPEEHSSSYRAGSADSAVPSATVEFTMDEQEETVPWDVDPEQGDYESAEEESEVDQSEDRGHYGLDGRLHESDKDDGSTQDPSDALDPFETALASSEQDEDEDIDSMQRPDDEGTHPAAKIESSVEYQSPNEQASDDNDSNLPDTAQISHQDPSDSGESHTQRDSQSGPGDITTSYFNVDGSAESRITPAAEIDVNDFLVGHEPALQPPEPLGSLSSLNPEFEHQLLTSDPTQEVKALNEPAIDLETETTYTIDNQKAPTELDTASRPLPVSDSPGLGEDDASQLDGHADEYHDALSAFELAQSIERTEQERHVPEVVVSTEPPKTPLVLVQPPAPDRHASGLRSKLSYFAPLATLIDHYDALVDTISIVQEVSPIARSKAGSKDWFVTVQLTDPSMAGTTLNAQIFRRYKASMPSLAEGSAILLRDFKVRSFEHAFMLVSVESSAWAVFDGSGPDAEMNGPPVEYDAEERAYASGLRRWYIEVGSASVADHMLQASIERDNVDREFTPNSEVPSESGSPSSKRGSLRRRRSNRRVTIHELRDGTRYTEIGSPNSRNSSVHELRDGTLYANI